MFSYQKFLVKENDRFHPENFPQIDISLANLASQLGNSLPASHIDMLLTFSKDHSLNTVLVKEHPDFANLILSKTLTLGVVEDLFESSRNNQAFQKGLDAHIRSYLSPASNGSDQDGASF